MKNHFALIVISLALVATACRPAFDAAKEKDAVLAVIQEEKDGYTNQDLDQWSKTVLKDPSYTWIASDCRQYWLNRGYEQQVDWIKQTWEDMDSEATMEPIAFKVMQVRVIPGAAWALIDVGNRLEMLFLEKEEDSWVISFQGIMAISRELEEKEEMTEE